MTEYIAQVDKDDNVVARRERRELDHDVFRHRISLVLPRLPDNHVLIAKRASDKKPFPNLYCCAVGGRVRYAESYEAAALREMREEVGQDVPVIELATSRMDHPWERGIYHVFTTEPVDPAVFTPNPREVASLDSHEPSQLYALMTKHPSWFAPAFRFAYEQFYAPYVVHCRKDRRRSTSE